jgi:hypothetical protein
MFGGIPDGVLREPAFVDMMARTLKLICACSRVCVHSHDVPGTLLPTIVPVTRQNGVSRANSSQVARSEKSLRANQGITKKTNGHREVRIRLNRPPAGEWQLQIPLKGNLAAMLRLADNKKEAVGIRRPRGLSTVVGGRM